MRTPNNIKKNGKDRVASYGSGGTSSQHQKKKSYRARGCRGGSSRKAGARRKQFANNENEENNPSLLNTIPEHENVNNTQVGASSHPKQPAMQRRASAEQYENTMRGVSILPKGGEVKQMNAPPPHRSTNPLDNAKPILPSVPLINANHTAVSMNGKRNVSSVIGRPSSASNKPDTRNNTGFSFFSISPRSFLSGKRKAMSPRRSPRLQRLHY